MKRIVHISTVHTPKDVRIFYKQLKTLAAQGFDVCFIVCSEKKIVEEDKVRFIILPKPPNRFYRMFILPIKVLKVCLKQKALVYHFHDPELIPLGIILKLCFKKVIYDVHEDISKDIYDKPYLSNALKPFLSILLNYLEKIGVFFFDKVVAATDSIYKKFPKNKAVLVRNFPLMAEMIFSSKPYSEERPWNIIYLGGMADFNGVYEILKALETLPKESKIRLILGGKFINESQEVKFKAMKAWDRVDYYGWVSRDKLAQMYAQARLGIVLYKPTPNIMECEPNKFYEVLSAGLPLLCTNLKRWSEFVTLNECGKTVDPDNPVEVGRIIQEMCSMNRDVKQMAANARGIIESHCNWENESLNLIDMYNRIVLN